MTFCQTCLKNFTINLPSIAINLFAKDGSSKSHLVWIAAWKKLVGIL